MKILLLFEKTTVATALHLLHCERRYQCKIYTYFTVKSYLIREKIDDRTYSTYFEKRYENIINF